MGAGVALELAIRMPHRVKSLVLVGGAAGGPATAIPELGEAARAAGTVWAETLRYRRPWLAGALFSPGFRAEHPDRVAAYMPYFTRHLAPPWASAWQTLAVACFGRGSELGRVRAPTLVLHGDEDVMVPPANALALVAGIPGAKLELVAGAGHAVPLEQPELSARLILEWVDRHALAEPEPARRQDVIGERLARPFALGAGSLRNSRDAARWAAGALGRVGRGR
jgi:3-oxoadipate enol-lactonase